MTGTTLLISGARHWQCSTTFRPQDNQSRGLYYCAPPVHPAVCVAAGRRGWVWASRCYRVAPDGGQAARRGLTGHPRRHCCHCPAAPAKSGGGLLATQARGATQLMTHGAATCVGALPTAGGHARTQRAPHKNIYIYISSNNSSIVVVARNAVGNATRCPSACATNIPVGARCALWALRSNVHSRARGVHQTHDVKGILCCLIFLSKISHMYI